MERIGNKVSYIRKPLAKYSLVAAGLTVVSYLFAVLSIGISYYTQGNAPSNAAALGLCSIVTTIASIVYGIFSFFEKEKNYLIAKICLAAAGLAFLFWIFVIILAIIQ